MYTNTVFGCLCVCVWKKRTKLPFLFKFIESPNRLDVHRASACTLKQSLFTCFIHKICGLNTLLEFFAINQLQQNYEIFLFGFCNFFLVLFCFACVRNSFSRSLQLQAFGYSLLLFYGSQLRFLFRFV